MKRKVLSFDGSKTVDIDLSDKNAVLASISALPYHNFPMFEKFFFVQPCRNILLLAY